MGEVVLSSVSPAELYALNFFVRYSMALAVPPNATFPATVPISDWLSSPDVRGYASWLVAFRAFPPILLAFVLVAGVLLFAAYRCATCCCCHRVRARSSKGASLLSWLLVLLAGAALAGAAYAAMGVLVTVGQLGGVAANTLNNASSFVCAANGSSCANDSLVGFADGLAARTAAAAADAGSFVANLSAPLDLLKATAAPAASLATLATGLNASIVSLSVELDELATSLDAARYHAKRITPPPTPRGHCSTCRCQSCPPRRSRTPRRRPPPSRPSRRSSTPPSPPPTPPSAPSSLTSSLPSSR